MSLYSAGYFKSRFTDLKQKRHPLENELKDIRDYILPDAGMFEGDKNYESNEKEYNDTYRSQVVNTLATESAKKLASAIGSTLMSSRSKWFRLSISEDLPGFEEEIWLQDAERILYELYHMSDFYSVANRALLESCVFGVGIFSIEDDSDTGFLFTNYTVGEYFIEENRKGKVEVVYRDVRMSYREFIDNFGEDTLTEDEENKISNNVINLDTSYIKLVHAVEPNTNYRFIHEDNPFSKKYISAYIRSDCDGVSEEKQIVSKKGFKDFPYIVFRWNKIGKNVYGSGIGREVLGSVKALQNMQKDKLNAQKKMVSPTMIANTSLRPVLIKEKDKAFKSNTVLFSNSKDAVRPAYEVKFDINAALEGIQKEEKSIKDKFLETMFYGVSDTDKNMSATEVSARKQEQFGMISGTIDGMQTELLNPFVDNTFSRAYDRNIIDPAPESLEGTSVEPRYVSLLAQSLDLTDISLLDRFLQKVAEIQPYQPDVGGKIKWGETVDYYAKKTGVNMKLLVDNESYNKQRAASAQAAQQQISSETASNNMKNIASATKDFSEANTSGKNVLNDLMGG